MIGGIHWYPQRQERGQVWAGVGPRGTLLRVRRAPLAADEPPTAGAYECWYGAVIVTRGISPCDAMEKLAKIAKQRGLV